MTLIPVHHGRHERRFSCHRAKVRWIVFWRGPYATVAFVGVLIVVFVATLTTVMVVML